MPKPPKRLAPVSVRLTPEKLLRLDHERGGMNRNAYIDMRVFDPDRPTPRLRGNAPVKDHQALASALAKLGQSQIPNNLNQLVKLAHSGSLALTPEIEAELCEAVRYVREIRDLLINALGLMDGRP